MSMETMTMPTESSPVEGRGRRPIEVEHLDLIGPVPKDRHDLVPYDAEVSVDFLTKIETMPFSDYLEFIGATYLEYKQETRKNSGLNTNQLLKNLHRKIVSQMKIKAEQLHQKFTTENGRDTNYQVETTRDHGQVFDKIINDLEIDGLSSESAPMAVDYLEGIDHIITFNHRELMSEEPERGQSEKLFIGVQRTFNPDKRKEVLKDPVRILPTDNGKGVVFRVFLQEYLSEYEDDNHETLMEKLDAHRRAAAKKAGVSPVEYGQTHRRSGYPGVYKVLPGGQVEQVKRVLRVFQEIKEQLHDFIASPDFKKQSSFVQKTLTHLQDNLHLEDYQAAVQTVEEA